MKINQTTSVVERGGITAENTFSIKASAKSFEILSSGLYSDKVLAVIRELSCNAYDAHVDANKAKLPFDIHLPNKLEPYFSVKDYGIGLSEKDTMTLYTTYFDSTKTHSNDFIGALGLGSKSPFSYTDAFEVIVRFNKTKKFYSVFINENGIPSIAKMGEIATTEPNGLEVKMTVLPSDFHIFRMKTRIALNYFVTKPKIIGTHVEFEWTPARTPILKSNQWKAYVGEYNDGKIVAVQGNVQYIVNIDLLKVSSDICTILQELTRTTTIVLYFNIGDLEIAASREALQYDSRTIQNIQNHLDNVLSGIKKRIMKIARDNKNCYWDAFVKLQEISNQLFNNSTLSNIFDVTKLRNKILKKYIEDGKSISLESIKICGHSIASYSRNTNMKKHQPLRNTINNLVVPKKNMEVMINDIKIGGVSRIGNFLYENRHINSLLVIKQIKLSDPEFNHQQELTQIIERLGNPIISNVSDLPTYTNPSSTNSTDTSLFAYLPHHTGAWADKISWQRHDKIDWTIGGFYFPLQHKRKIFNGIHRFHYNERHIHDELKLMHKLASNHLGFNPKDITPAVIGVNSRVDKALQKCDNWYNIFSVLEQLYPKYVNLIKIDNQLQHTKHICIDTFELLVSDIFINSISKSTSLYKVVSKISKFEKDIDPKRNEIKLLEHCGLKINTDGVKPLMDIESFKIMYPMLRYIKNIRNYDNTQYINDIIKYIMNINGGQI